MYQTLCSSFFSSYGEGELIFGQSLYSFISWVFSRRQGVRIFVRDGRVRRRTFWIFSAWNKFTDDNLEAVWVVTLKLTGQCAMLLYVASVHVVDKSEVPGSKVDFFFSPIIMPSDSLPVTFEILPYGFVMLCLCCYIFCFCYNTR